MNTNIERAPVINREQMTELRRLAVPIVKLVAQWGDMNREVRITSLGVEVFSPDAGAWFTEKEEAEIFQEEAIRA